MDDNLKKSVADSLETDEELLTHIPFLLKDLWLLGSSLDKILEVIRELNLPEQTTKVLDLGCGKGAVTISIANEFGFKCLGIDGCKEFLDEAEIKSIEFGTTDLVTFKYDDVNHFVKTQNDFDVVIYASLGGVLGNFEDIISKLRNVVKSGGYIIIDDGYLKEGKSLKRKAYEHYRYHDETIRQLKIYSDEIIEEISTEEKTKNINDEYTEIIKESAKELINKYPHLKTKVEKYVQNQEEECKILEEYINGALWIVKKK